MGMWYNYTIQLANEKSGNLTDKLIQKGILERAEENDFVWVNLKALNAELFKDGYKEDGFERIKIRTEEDGSLFYINNGVPDQRLAFEFSRHLDDLLFITEESDYGDQHYWYEKNGDICTKDGKEVKGAIMAINPKLVSLNGNGYKIALPIGNEQDKWGTIYLKEECVAHRHSLEADSLGFSGPVSVFFDKERIPVYFKSGKIEMGTSEIKNRYTQSREDYRCFANQPIILEVPHENVSVKMIRNMPRFFVVTIPCSPEYSSNEEMSFAASFMHDTGEGTYVIDIGSRFTEHKVYYKEGERTANTQFKNCKIAEIFMEGLEKFICSDAVKNQIHANEESFKLYPAIYVDDFVAREQQENTEEESFEK